MRKSSNLGYVSYFRHRAIGFFLPILIACVWTSWVAAAEPPLSTDQISSLLKIGSKPEEIKKMAGDRGLAGALDDAALQKLKDSGADADLLVFLMNLGSNSAGEASEEGEEANSSPAQIVADDFDKLTFEEVKALAEKGNAHGEFHLGRRFEKGEGVEKDTEEAAKWYRKAAEQGHAAAQKSLGVMYIEGRGVEKDEAAGIDWLQKAAEQGDTETQGLLAFCYENGIGVERDLFLAAEWYKKAAERGSADAQVALGNCYVDGLGVGKDLGEAMFWFGKAAAQGDEGSMAYLAKVLPEAAKQGDPYSQNALGLCYLNGSGVTKDETEAVKWFRKAAEQEYAEAQNYLGECYVRGTGVEKDTEMALECFFNAMDQGHSKAKDSYMSLRHELAENGDADAQYFLGVLYWQGMTLTDNTQVPEKNTKEGMKWLLKAAAQNNSGAQHYIGLAYFNGDGVGLDYVEAAKWFRKAAEQGDASLQYKLGLNLYHGEFLPEDKTEAMIWLRKSAAQGNKDAIEKLEEIKNEKSPDVPEDKVRAEAERGDAYAQMVMGFRYSNGKGVKKDRKEAAKWFRKAAEQGDADGQYMLGSRLYYGDGVEKDEAEGVTWLRKAAAQEHKHAREFVEGLNE